jgi:hypothetical protein
MIVYICLVISIICSAVQDAVIFNNAFAKWGLYFSRDGWKNKYLLTEWFNKYLPLWLSKFLAQDILVIFCDLFHTAKTIMIASFIVAIFGLTWTSFIVWALWGFGFNFVYYAIR